MAPRHLYLNVLMSLANDRKLCKPKEQPIFMTFSHQSFLPLLPILEKISSMLGRLHSGFSNRVNRIPWKIYYSFTVVFKKNVYIFRRMYLNRNGKLCVHPILKLPNPSQAAWLCISLDISHLSLCKRE